MSKILLPLAMGFEEIEAITIIDVCRRAGIDVVVAGVGTTTVVGAHCISIVTDCLIDTIKVDELDMVVLPGGWGGTEVLAENLKVQAILKQMKKDDKHIGAICAAPYALNQAGVLSEEFTCYPSVENKIHLEGYRPDRSTIVEGKVITSQGVGTAIEFALELVRILEGESVYQKLKDSLLVDA